MRISDWSSDVCSSDLPHGDVAVGELRHADRARNLARQPRADRAVGVADRIGELHLFAAREHRGGILDDLRVEAVGHLVAEARQREAALVRSEEHTSELQSLMRISYAVLCLQKKKK